MSCWLPCLFRPTRPGTVIYRSNSPNRRLHPLILEATTVPQCHNRVKLLYHGSLNVDLEGYVSRRTDP